MNILITGTRKTNNVERVFTVLSNELKYGRIKKDDTIIHGGAMGIDCIAEAWCKTNKIKSKIITPIFPSKPEYYLHRNAEMVGMCERCIAFWDGKSRGTKFTFQYARKRGLNTEVFDL